MEFGDNAGYSQGYLGINLTGSHTKDFFLGYMNGTQAFVWNKGYACGISGKTNPSPGHVGLCGDQPYGTPLDQFHSGNNTGWKNRIDLVSTMYGDRDHLLQIVLPANTTDGYKDYFVGFANGVQSYESHSIDNVFTAPCNGTAEYCTGFKAGWNEDFYNQD